MLTSFTSILTASASKAFSINSLTTLETEVTVCVLVTSFTVDDGSCLIDIFHSSKTDGTVFIVIITLFQTNKHPPAFPLCTRRLTAQPCAVCTYCQPFTSKAPVPTYVAKHANSQPRNREILAFQSVLWCTT